MTKGAIPRKCNFVRSYNVLCVWCGKYFDWDTSSPQEIYYLINKPFTLRTLSKPHLTPNRQIKLLWFLIIFSQNLSDGVRNLIRIGIGHQNNVNFILFILNFIAKNLTQSLMHTVRCDLSLLFGKFSNCWACGSFWLRIDYSYHLKCYANQ